MRHSESRWFYCATHKTSVQTQRISCSHSFDSLPRVPGHSQISNSSRRLGDDLGTASLSLWFSAAKALKGGSLGPQPRSLTIRSQIPVRNGLGRANHAFGRKAERISRDHFWASATQRQSSPMADSDPCRNSSERNLEGLKKSKTSICRPNKRPALSKSFLTAGETEVQILVLLPISCTPGHPEDMCRGLAAVAPRCAGPKAHIWVCPSTRGAALPH